jgi:cytochrome c
VKKVLLIIFFISISCQNDSKGIDALDNKGVGPIINVILEDKVNISMANSGEKLFNQLCTSCHIINEDYIGPAMSGILDRRSPEWIMNMILNPIQMLEEDPIAIELLEKYNFEYMYNQNLLEEEAREILEYFRLLD